MCRFFTLITCIVIAAGAMSDNGITLVKRGEQYSLSVRTSEPKMVSRFTVRRNGTQEVFRYCSPEEQNLGCKPINSERGSFHIGKENVSVTFLHANTGDEGVYDVEVIDSKNKVIPQKFTIALTEQLSSTVSPEPPSIHSLDNPEDVPIKGKETPSTISLHLIIIAAGVALLTAVVILAIIGVINYITNCKKGKQNNAGDGARDSENIPLSSTSSAASKATDESQEMVDEAECSLDNNSQREEGTKDLNHEDRRMTDKAGRTRHCVDSQNNHKG